ncbi:hypothetical protein H9Y04_06540 [Streptomyces sp. TRM66268-LWL]|uniref:Uncharacterized protein n=1 Tax=Streptomyces polyasparticus TaxID=2767826 RepID=A0ABR7SB44_9ACTN|nr:hypothetical protein [Streptomyces polyasparticus]MBC9712229.1 hypothetical protein [Streptomyces polyasparticus]
MTATTDARQGEYVTYAPKGEKCAKCKQGFGPLERVWRLTVERQSGAPAFGPYQHYEKCR